MQKILCGLLAGACFSLPAMAGPFSVSSPHPADAWTLKLGGEFKGNREKDVLTLPKLGIEFPVSRNVSLEIEGTYRRFDPAGAAATDGIGDTALSGKWQFVHADSNSLGLEIGTEPELLLPTGDEDKDLGDGHVSIYVPLVLQMKAGKWKYGAEFGYAHLFGRHEDELTAGVMVSREMFPGFEFGGELVTYTPPRYFSDAELNGNLGVKWEVSERLELQLLAGHSLHTHDGVDKTKLKFGIEWKI